MENKVEEYPEDFLQNEVRKEKDFVIGRILSNTINGLLYDETVSLTVKLNYIYIDLEKNIIPGYRHKEFIAVDIKTLPDPYPFYRDVVLPKLGVLREYARAERKQHGIE